MTRPHRSRALLLLAAIVLATAVIPAVAMDRGSYVARLGDCVSCHTAPSGKPFVGGLRMPTPLGAIFTTNITPDKATGIGNWSFADFDLALRRGIAKDGRHLYPAMPYPSFAKLSDGDMRSLYEFFMTSVVPVNQPNRTNEIVWPLNMRWPLAIWNELYLNGIQFQPKRDRDAVWNRGAYLVEGIAHCGACHTPRGIAWNEQGLDARNPRFLSGEMLDFWFAPDLRGDPTTGLGAWLETDIVAFLKSGRNVHGAVFGAMSLVTSNSTRNLSDTDLAAIATYLKSLPPRRPEERAYVYNGATTRQLHVDPTASPGSNLYAGQCAPCHGADGKGQAPHIPPLAGNPPVLSYDPTSAIHIVLDGATPPDGSSADRMPAFRATLSDEQIASVTSFIRNGWGNRGGAVGPLIVATIRAGTSPTLDRIGRGAALVAQKGCGACHVISRVSGASGLVGAPLDNIGERVVIAGMLANTPDNMAKWLQSPQRIKPGDAMPDIGLSRDDARDMAAFLATLRN